MTDPPPARDQPADSAAAGPSAPSFAKPLFLGEIHEDLVFPYPRMSREERDRVEALTASAREFLGAHYDPRRAEAERWVGDDVLAGLGERGVLGLYVPTEYGGQGLTQTGYCKVFETIGAIDPTLAVVLGVHQSIGMKGIYMFGSEEQKQRFLPDLARGKKLAGFALTEPEAGSDAYHIKTRAARQPDGSWRLDGEKRWIGNGGKDVLVTFARTDQGEHVAFILEKGMAGLEVGRRYDTMGLRANDLRHLRYNGVRVPEENLLGAVGDGFRIAVEVLNNGRMSLGAGSVGATKGLLDLALEHVTHRRQFGRPLAEFELVQEKLAWMVAYLYGLEATGYLATGLVDRGVPDYSLESAMIKVAGTEFLWYAANRVFQLAGGEAYMADRPYEKILRDIRVFPIFEGSNDVLRLFIALSGLEPLGAELSDLGEKLDLATPLRGLGALADYVGGRIRRRVHPDRLTRAHPDLAKLADPLADQVRRLRETSERLLRRHGKAIKERQSHLKRLAHAAMDVFAQVATISRVTDVLAAVGPEMSGEERYIAETFCTRARHRVERSLDQIDHNDDDRMGAIARATLHRGSYGHSI